TAPGAGVPASGASPASGEVEGADTGPDDQQRQIFLPWRYIRRAEQPPPLRIGSTTVSVDVYDADFEPLSTVEELLLTGIREHVGTRRAEAAAEGHGGSQPAFSYSFHNSAGRKSKGE
ncbi:MAG: hypothetical protein ACTMH0_06175, partial [Brevibacterium linens]